MIPQGGIFIIYPLGVFVKTFFLRIVSRDGIIGVLATTPIRQRRGGALLEYIITFILSVAASVVSYYICKWLDDKLGGK